MKIEMHSLKQRCLMSICLFIKYILWSTYSVSNAACYHGIACEGRLIFCPEGQVASDVLPAAALPQHWSGFLQVIAAGWFFCPDETLPSSVPMPGGDQVRRLPGTFQLPLWSPDSLPSGELR